MKSFLHAALAAAIVFVSPAFAKDRIEISPEILKPDTELSTFRVSEVFKALLASYREEIALTKADTKLSEQDKATRIERLKKHATELLLLHERVVNISPVA